MNDQDNKGSFSERRRQFVRSYRERRKVMSDARKEKMGQVRGSISKAATPVTGPWKKFKNVIDENRKISYPILFVVGFVDVRYEGEERGHCETNHEQDRI